MTYNIDFEIDCLFQESDVKKQKDVGQHIDAYYGKILILKYVLFLGDDRWYRAVVLRISASEVKVAYADYGNVEVLPLTRLHPIPAFLLDLPFQIFKCSLAGIKPTRAFVIMTLNSSPH